MSGGASEPMGRVLDAVDVWNTLGAG